MVAFYCKCQSIPSEAIWPTSLMVLGQLCGASPRSLWTKADAKLLRVLPHRLPLEMNAKGF